MISAATLRILVRDFQSDGFNRNSRDLSPLRLQFTDFSIEYIEQGYSDRLKYVRQFFDEAMYGDCLIERDYQVIPPLARDSSGLGRIILAPEEILLLLRLFRPGDLVFAAVKIEKLQEGETLQLSLKPYRVISSIGGDSTRPFVLHRSEVTKWETFAAELRSSPAWTATWFQVARHCFLYGSSDEFNPNFSSEVNRVTDYIAALEAALVPETDFVSRRLRERAVRLLGLEGSESKPQERLLNEMYSIRSTLVHGNPLSVGQLSLVQDREQWWQFEEIVRKPLVAALKNVPFDEIPRNSYLASLYDIDDEARVMRIRNEFRAIKDPQVKQSLLKSLT